MTAKLSALIGTAVTETLFEGRLRVTFSPQSLMTDAAAERQMDEIKASVKFTDKQLALYAKLLSEFSVILSCLVSLEVAPEYTAGVRPEVDALIEWVSTRASLSPAELWAVRYAMPYAIIEELRGAFTRAQTPYVKKKSKPGWALTPDERAEVADPDSPLAPSAELGAIA